MRNPDFRPLAVLFGYTVGADRLIFIGRKGEKVIDGYSREIINILKYCNGLNTSSDIKKKVGLIEDEIFFSLLDLLLEQDIICDSRSIYENFHRDSANPMEFFHNWSLEDIASIERMPKKKISLNVRKVISLGTTDANILELIRSRHTVRRFKKGLIKQDKLAGLLESIYRTEGSHSIPSAGGLYPLEIYVAILQKVGDINPGWYQYSSAEQTLSLLDIPSGTERVCQILDSVGVIENANFVIFFGADFSRTAMKYSNRGYRFVLMEVGHAAQNANLYCVENGLGAVEWGGFNDLQLTKELKLDYPKQGIALAMVVGIPDETKEQYICEPFYDESCQLKAELVGKGKPVKFIRLGEASYGDYTMPRVVASAKYGFFGRKSGQGRNFAFASGRTTAEASVKVIAEGFERYASGCLRVDKVSSAGKLEKPFIDPRVVTPLSIKQYDILNLEPFDPLKEWQWVLGHRLVDQEETYVAVDNVFYPLYAEELGRSLCYAANSSGVAAYFKKEIAIKKALLELIERDAIAVTWYSKRTVTALPHSLASGVVRDRINFWKSQKKRVKFLNMILDSVPVVMCLIFSDDNQYPCLVSGAAADFSFKAAMEKSFNEAEYMLLSWRKARPKKIFNIKDVVSAPDHGKLYFWPGQQRYLSWLINAEEKKPAEVDKKKDIFTQFNPVVVDITPSKEASLSVVRVLSEKLMPMNFGYGSEHYRHSRLDMLGLSWKWEFPAQPHFFA